MLVKSADFTEKQSTSYCIDLDTRDRQVIENCQRIPGRVETVPDHDKHIAVVCYGPSLEETWEQLKSPKFDTIMTCSGAHKFLVDRGIIPTYHAEVDPRPHKAELIGTPHPDVEYLCASVCHQAVFDLLEGYKVKLWHVFANEAGRREAIYAYPRGEWALTGGSNVGVRCLVLARFLGYKKMTIFGMDFSFKADGTQHAGWHPKEISNVHAVEVDGEWFYTNPPMHRYAQEFFKEIGKLGNIEIEAVGHGLLQARIREHLKTKPLIPKLDKPPMIAAAVPLIASAQHISLNCELHRTNPSYGISGSKRAAVVKRLIDSIKATSVLDYGCGKGTLAQSLPMPIWEYDPAIPGKDSPPRPADLVVCTDVLEHVEPDYLSTVILDLARCTTKVCYVVIHSGPSLKTLPDGRNTHLIQQPMEWWKEQLEPHFHIAKCDQEGPEITMVLGKKKNGPPPLDTSERITPARHKGTEVRFYTPNDQTQWRASTLFTKEPCTIDWIDTFQPGEVFYDIGANVGGYSIWAAKRRDATVYAFEPEASNYAVLCKNFALNEVRGSAFCLSVSNQTQLSTLYLSSPIAGGSCHSFGQSVDPHLKPKMGPVQGSMGITLDGLSLPPPDHLKIDVDGLEHLVIMGASELLQRGVKSLLVEVNTNLPEHVEMVKALEAYGYTYDPVQVEKATRKEGNFKGCAEYIFTFPTPVEESILATIEHAELKTYPYPYLEIENFFPDGAYADLLARLPAESAYETLEKARKTTGYPERFVHSTPPSLNWMCQGRLRAALDRKFGVHSHTDETLLIRDKPGYTIKPHTDTPTKAVTMLVFLGEANHGTSLYTPVDPTFKDPHGIHHAFEEFREVARVSGKPNSAFIFARTDTSFHGTVPYPGPGVRDLLLYDSRKVK